MKINQIIAETTTAGSVSTVAMPLGEVQSRTQVAGLQPAEKVMKGKIKKKGPYANSLTEGAMKQLSMDLKELKDEEFKKKYNMTKQEVRKELSAKPEPIKEAELAEDDIILVPGQGSKMRTGFVPHGKSRVDHEVEMARSDLFSAAKNAQKVHAMIKHVSEDEGLEGWVQEKIIKANDYLNTVREYLEGKQAQGVAEDDAHDIEQRMLIKIEKEKQRLAKLKQTDPEAYKREIAKHKQTSRMPAVSTFEGAKVDRMVKHIEKSERKLGKSKDEAENIAWATANKRGMLDNKNKKAK
jgi:hypothetical protein